MSTFDKTPRTSVPLPSTSASPLPPAAARSTTSTAANDDEVDQPSSAKLPLLNVQIPNSSTNSDDKADEPSAKLSATSTERKASRPSTRPALVPALASPVIRCSSPLRDWIASGDFGAFFLTTVILVAIVYVIMSIAMDRSTVHNSYTSLFAPDFSAVPSAWDFVVVMVATMTSWFTCGLFGSSSNRFKRKSAFIACGVYALLLVIGNVIEFSETAARRASESTFAARFNAIYCDVRTLRMCLEDDPKALLGLTGVNATAALPSSPDKDQAPLAECPMLMARAVSPILIGGSSNAKLRAAHMVNGEDVLKTDGKTLNAFLDDCESSTEIDKWCVDALARKTPMSDAEQLALPSPFASNPSIFATYVSNRARYMFVSNVMLGTIAICFLLAGVGYDLAAKYEV